MFKRPEEIIVLVLAALWVALTYFTATYIGTNVYTIFLITGLTLAWAVICFILWQRNLSGAIWPFFLGCLVACWWPILDWFAIKDFIVPGAESQTLVIAKPWYAGWTFKIILATIPVILGYVFKWKRARQRQFEQASSF